MDRQAPCMLIYCLCLLRQILLDKHPDAFILLNNFQQQCLLRQMDRLLEKHPYAIDAFIVDFSSMMFAKKNKMTVV